MENYINGAMVLETVIHKPMICEDDAWCQLDYAVCKYNNDGNFEMGLKRLQEIRNWIVQHQEELEFLSVDEIDQVIRTIKIIKMHKIKKGGT